MTFFAHSPWSRRWRVGIWGKCQRPHHGVPWAVPLVHSPAVQGTGIPSSNPTSSLKVWLKSQKTSQFPRIWWRRGAVPLQSPWPVAHRDSDCVCGAPVCGRCVWTFICLWLSSRLMQKYALKKKKKLCYAVAKCSIDVSFNWPQEAFWLPVHSPQLHWGFSHTLISGVSTVH